jgi:hypothetical protein
MKSKKSSGGFRDDNDSFQGNRKKKLTPIKKQKSKKTQFFDAIEDFDDDLVFRDGDTEELYEDLEELEDLEAIDDLEKFDDPEDLDDLEDIDDEEDDY